MEEKNPMLTESQSERYLELTRYRSYYVDEQHIHKQVNWNDTPAVDTEVDMIAMMQSSINPAKNENVKLDNKRPDAPEGLGEVVVNTFTDLLFEEDRKPTIACTVNKEWDKWYRNFVAETNFYEAWSEARNNTGSSSSALITLEFNDGVPLIAVVESRHCLPTFSKAPKFKDELESVLIQYVYRTEEIVDYVDQFASYSQKNKRRIESVLRWYRRVITRTSDTLYNNPLQKDNDTPEFTVVSSFDHNFGYVPALWLRNDRDCGIDSITDYNGALGLFDKIDMLSSQIARSSLYNGDPTIHIATNNPQEGTVVTGSFSAYQTEVGGSVSFVELTGESIKTMMLAKKELKNAALTKCRVSLELASVSGRDRVTATEITKSQNQMFAKASKLRERFGSYMRRFLHMAAKSCSIMNPGKSDGNYDPSTYSVEDDFIVPGGKVERPEILWGKFVNMSPSELKTLSETISVMISSGVIDKLTAIEMIAKHVSNKSPEEILKTLNSEETGDDELETNIEEIDNGDVNT